jgi:glycosyltransferase involved in cell wall biosynthesis
MVEKYKVVWLCGFTNANIQKQIKPFQKVGSVAPWISHLIDVFKNNDLFEIHIISPHEYISGYKHFIQNNINYHFVNQGMPIWGRNWPSFLPFDLWTDYFFIKKSIKKIIHRIQPDIIHLHGAENTYHTSAILQFKGLYPVLISVQGFITKSSSNGKRVLRRKAREIEIFKTFNHYGYRTDTMAEDIRKLNCDAVLHYLRYPVKKILPVVTEKKFDIVFFARITKEKGIIDLLHAIFILHKSIPDLKVCIIGKGKLSHYKQLAAELKIDQLIFWAGFLPSQNDVHRMASAAKVCVLPTYHEIISGTILESLFLGLPVVAYDVGSIHEVNKYGDIITLVDKGDIDGLADSILKLLMDEQLRNEKSEKGKECAINVFATDDQKIKSGYLQSYKQVIQDFNSKKQPL